MAKAKVPPGDAPEELRIEPEKVGFDLWYVERFPVARLGGRLDKDPEANPWVLGLLDAIRREGRLLNPVIVWNHHPMRGGKQPEWLLRAGSNRVWCAEQLGWTHVPAVVSTARTDLMARIIVTGLAPQPVAPENLQSLFPDGGSLWANEHGFGLLRAKKPEVTYADYRPTREELAAVRETDHGRDRIVNPMIEPT